MGFCSNPNQTSFVVCSWYSEVFLFKEPKFGKHSNERYSYYRTTTTYVLVLICDPRHVHLFIVSKKWQKSRRNALPSRRQRCEPFLFLRRAPIKIPCRPLYYAVMFSIKDSERQPAQRTFVFLEDPVSPPQRAEERRQFLGGAIILPARPK